MRSVKPISHNVRRHEFSGLSEQYLDNGYEAIASRRARLARDYIESQRGPDLAGCDGMTADQFCTLLRQRLESVSDRVLLRVLVSGRKDGLVEFTGAEILARSLEFAQCYCQALPSGVVLILLPHSPELFLLHLGLVLIGRLPAILAWPTNRIDPEKYQRNILHQLRSLPAAQLLTLPKLAQNLNPGMPFTVTECPINECERFESLFSVDLDVPRVEKQVLPYAKG